MWSDNRSAYLMPTSTRPLILTDSRCNVARQPRQLRCRRDCAAAVLSRCMGRGEVGGPRYVLTEWWLAPEYLRGAADQLRANSNYASNEYFLPVMGLVLKAWRRQVRRRGSCRLRVGCLMCGRKATSVSNVTSDGAIKAVVPR
jgi:hypothetical protein